MKERKPGGRGKRKGLQPPIRQRHSCQHSESTPKSIIFVSINYHSSDLLRELLLSISSQRDKNSSLLIVNNSPDDGGLSDLSTLENIIILQAERNLGFGGGCNLALDYLEKNDPEAVAWLINPDAQLLPGAIRTVRKILQLTSNPTIYGTRILDSDGNMWFDHGRFAKHLGRVNHEPMDPSANKKEEENDWVQRCDWVSGCSLIIDLTIFPEVPYFDEHIFLYYEDAELCLRLQRDGVSCYVTKTALVSHRVSATTGRDPIGKYRHATFGKLYLLHQHGTPWSVAINLFRYCMRAAADWPHGSHEATGRMLGILSYLNWLLGSPSQRSWQDRRSSSNRPGRGTSPAGVIEGPWNQ